MDRELTILGDPPLAAMDGTRYQYVEGAGYLPLADNYYRSRIIVQLDRVLKHHELLVGEVMAYDGAYSWNFHWNDDDRDWYTYFGGRLCIGTDRTFVVVVELEE